MTIYGDAPAAGACNSVGEAVPSSCTESVVLAAVTLVHINCTHCTETLEPTVNALEPPHQIAEPSPHTHPRRVMPAQFPSPFTFESREPVTLVELRMRSFSGRIRSKPDWWEKVNNSAIVTKWREEIVEQDRTLVDKLWGGEERFVCEDGSKKWPRDPITQAQVDYIIDELKFEATQRDPETGIFVSCMGWPQIVANITVYAGDIHS